MPESLAIAILQRTILPGDPSNALLGTLEMLGSCARHDVDLLVLTELWSSGIIDDEESATELAESINGPTVEALREFCRKAGKHILAGTIALRDGGRFTNTALLIDPSGEIILRHDKTHLFAPMGEDRIFSPGDTLSAAEINGIGVGVLICYELRFPMLARRLAHSGCEVIVVPALWPETRISHWETLLRARAIENQVFVAGANGICNQGGVLFPGHSLVASPNGEALNRPEMRESLIVRRLEIGQVRALRREISFLDDERDIVKVNWHRK